METIATSTLAIHGGNPVRKTPMPARLAIGENESQLLMDALKYYQQRGQDPCYQGYYEKRYTDDFATFQGGGYADAVCTGTASLFVALAALNLEKGSEVLVSPITDPGTLSAIILNQLKPKLIDSAPHSFNVSMNEVIARTTDKTRCMLIVHAAGQAAPIEDIAAFCQSNGILLLEDCSQAHGAIHANQKVGTFGDIAAFSTMYRKASITGPTGGIVYSQNLHYHQQALAHADRGKATWEAGFNDRDPNLFLFPALNLHANELGCAIGIASLKRLPLVIKQRFAFVKSLTEKINAFSKVCTPYPMDQNDSPFIFPIFVNETAIRCSKTTFAKALLAEGIGLNPHYHYLVSEWPWLKPYLVDDYSCHHASETIDSCFCLYLNECYTDAEVDDIISAILKVEKYFIR